ncbi:MAG: 5,10-methylenetetrahydrofolate reductase [Phycisphaerales bacterium]|jgi:methylenetetrahydrofolate reductase (NADPH)|nr:5,10-methylenetetrahydrofolate reductase [Phycisphaerales bacterium]MBT7170139.1 5,10-methylenetetrahydrofolate reductase [Phycisphaerales bacterium]
MAVSRIDEIFRKRLRTLSFEFFPPKTDKGREGLFAAAESLMDLNPDFFSVTYGAGGTTAENTLSIVKELQERHEIPVMHHFTCTKHSRVELRQELEDMQAAGVTNLLALRGDPPANEQDYVPGKDEPRYAFELLRLIREYGDAFCVGVAAFPENHPRSENETIDSLVLRMKQETGADFAITQLFFENDHYRNFIQRTNNVGVTMRRIPGILPVTNLTSYLRFCTQCDVAPSDAIVNTLRPHEEDADAMATAGVDFAIRQCQDLLDSSAPGLHFYCLNKAEPVTTICRELGQWR